VTRAKDRDPIKPVFLPRQLWSEFNLPAAMLADMLWFALTQITEGDEQQALEDFRKLGKAIFEAMDELVQEHDQASCE
jgi:hypothetical protein